MCLRQVHISYWTYSCYYCHLDPHVWRHVSTTVSTTVICRYSWGRGEGRFNPEKNKGPGEDLHHNPWGHLQFWLHRSVSLLLRYGRPGKMAGSLFIHFGLSSSIYSIYIVMHYFSPRDLLVWCISHQTKEILSVKHSCLLHPLSRWEKISIIISVECVSNNI